MGELGKMKVFLVLIFARVNVWLGYRHIKTGHWLANVVNLIFFLVFLSHYRLRELHMLERSDLLIVGIVCDRTWRHKSLLKLNIAEINDSVRRLPRYNLEFADIPEQRHLNAGGNSAISKRESSQTFYKSLVLQAVVLTRYQRILIN